MPFAILLPQVFNTSQPLIALWFGLPFLHQLFVDLHYKGALMIIDCELATLGEEHRDLVNLEHAVGEEEFCPVHRFFNLELYRLPATGHVSVTSKGLMSHTSFLQITALISIIFCFGCHAQRLESLHILVRLGVIATFARLTRKVVSEWDLDLITDLLHGQLDYLNLKEAIRCHNRGNLSQEDIVEDESEVLKALLNRQFVILLK